MKKDDPKRAAKALLFYKDKYLLMLRSDKDEIFPSQWDIPGGGVEKGETPEEALVREVREEAGIDISSLKPAAINTWEVTKENKLVVGGTDFLCVLDKLWKIKLSSEHVRAQWFTKEEVAASTEIPLWLKRDVEKAVDFMGSEKENVKSLITYDDFQKLDIRIGKILAAERVKDSDKLLRLEVDFGQEKRQIVAGIAQYFVPESIVGSEAPFVFNLEPRVLRGVKSEGMILAASSDGKVALLHPSHELPPGSVVK